MERICPVCQILFTGRSDKRFCSDQCRSSYHNNANRELKKLIYNINRILIQNRRVLTLLNPNGKAKVHRRQLEAHGFQFDYFTDEFLSKSGKSYRFCYDQGYLAIDQDYYFLVVKQKYLQ